MAGDFLDEIIAKRTARNPAFPQMVEEAMARQDHARHPPPEGIVGAKVGMRYDSEKLREMVAEAREVPAPAKKRADRRKRKTSA